MIKEKELDIDLSCHVVYSKKSKAAIIKLLKNIILILGMKFLKRFNRNMSFI